MKKKIFGLMVGLLAVGVLTACGNGSSNDPQIGENKNTKGNCNVIECIKKLKPENTVEEINSIIGFEGELVDEKYNKYYWKLSEETGVTVTYYSGKTGTITIDYVKSSLANSKVDLSKYDDLKPRIKEGISYKDFISYIGNVEGTIVEKSNYSTKYVWVATDGSYLNGSFSNSSGNCTFASGMIR